MSGEQAPRKLAIARGPSLARSSAIHRNITAAIASRVAERPQGAIRTYDDHGNGRAVSYLELWRRSGRIASGLCTLGVRPGAHVVLLVEDAVDFAAVFWACLRSGLTAVPLTSVAYEGLRHRQPGVFREALRQLDPVAVVADKQYAEFVNALQDELRLPLVIPLSAAEEEADNAIEDAMPADPACIIPTSGSTSQIKLAAIGQEAFAQSAFLRADESGPALSRDIPTGQCDGARRRIPPLGGVDTNARAPSRRQTHRGTGRNRAISDHVDIADRLGG